MPYSIREMLEQREKDTLCEAACLSSMTKGRRYAVIPDATRTEFQRDRDRILHSKAFRRLMHKTQVFLCPEDDHYRTRLTHTLEVAQVARTIARALRLNEDLTEAIALGHDLGHTPFGHAGERMLQKSFSPDFAHYYQSLRVVDELEQLNLTFEVRDGIVNHAGDCQASTLEGRIVKQADRIAYINHDIDDACRAGIISGSDIPKELLEILGDSHGKRIETMVCSVIRAGVDDGDVKMEEEIADATMCLREFLFESVYTNPDAKGEEVKAEAMLQQLYFYFVEHPDRLPTNFGGSSKDAPQRRAADFISGMTDRYAINLYRKLFIPDLWAGSARLEEFSGPENQRGGMDMIDYIPIY